MKLGLVHAALALGLVVQGCDSAMNTARPADAAVPVGPGRAAVAPAPPPLPVPPDVANPPADAEKTASGLLTHVLEKGNGDVHPDGLDTVVIQHTGWMRDGQMFDSSVLRQKPDKFRLDQVIPGWREALSLMVAGEKRRVWVLADMAFGAAPRGPNQPYGDLTYDIELVQILKMPKVPEDVRAPPKSATRTLSGIAYRVLRQGYGKVHAEPRAAVDVQYTGWTTDGHMFVTTSGGEVQTHVSAAFWPPGLAEAVLMMFEGEVTRFWIPTKLATGGMGPPGGVPPSLKTPGGIAVYDIELTKVFPMRWH